MTYTAKQKINATVTFMGVRTYTRSAYAYGYEDVTINKFMDEDGMELVWKTTTGTIGKDIIIKEEDGTGWCDGREVPNYGAKITIKGSVKNIGEYNGKPQVELTRVKLVESVEQTKSKEELQAEKAEAQRNSLQGKDIIWRMPYKQFKEHYSDCETISGSFKVDERDGVARIEVIIREGRMKNSGTRGKCFNYFSVINENGETAVYKAITEENAIKQAQKEFPENTWMLNGVYL